MPFEDAHAAIRSDLVRQGEWVQSLLLSAVEAWFDLDEDKARAAVMADDEIDRVDVEIERASVPLLAMGETDHARIRSVLTIVKINNELERIADSGVNIAEIVLHHREDLDRAPDPAFRVMANSVVGMTRDAARSFADLNEDLAAQVLAFDDTVDRFRNEILLSAEQKVAATEMPVRYAFRLRSTVAQLERVADHSTNIAEQVIYLRTGKTVRHLPDGWTSPADPT